MAYPLKTVTLTDQQCNALAWVLLEACEISYERLPGLRRDNPEAAAQEVADLASLAEIVPESDERASMVREAIEGLRSLLP